MLSCVLRYLLVSITLLFLAAPPTFAAWKAAIVSAHSGAPGLAIDSAGTIHVVAPKSYKGSHLIYRTYHPDGTLDRTIKTQIMQIFGAPTIVTDSQNRPHIALVTNELDYLDFDGRSWNYQPIAPIDEAIAPVYKPMLTLDSNDHPHLAYLAANGLLAHAFFDGTAWRIENTGVPMTPTAIQIAADGTVHIAGLSEVTNQPSQVCEERGLNGVWTGECFANASYFTAQPPSLVLASDSSPEVLYWSDSEIFYETLLMARFDGAHWTTQTIFDASTVGLDYFITAAVAIDSAGHLKMMLVDDGYNLHYAAQEGDAWAVTNLGDTVNFSDITLAVDSIGLPHIAFGFQDVFSFAIYVALTLPDLTDRWQSVVAHSALGKTVVTGKLQVTNIGTAPTAKSAINYYLSTDNQFDPDDTLLGSAKLALGPDQSKVVDFKFSPAGSVSGQYLIAVTTPANSPDEVNANSNVAAAVIP